MQCVRANHDIKLITNGAETMDISFYVAQYVAKRQGNSSNASALLAKRLAFHNSQERYSTDIVHLNKQLLQRCANTLSREQEFSGPEVISYLMGWGDRFISHFFVTIYWSSVKALIKKSVSHNVHEKVGFFFELQTLLLVNWCIRHFAKASGVPAEQLIHSEVMANDIEFTFLKLN